MSFPAAFTGRLGADPEIKFSANGSCIAKMRVVTNARRLVDGAWEDTDTSWWTVTAFGKVAEAIGDQVAKGELVMVYGKIKMREWEQDGAKRSAPEIIADQVAKVVRTDGPPKPKAHDPATDGWATTDSPF